LKLLQKTSRIYLLASLVIYFAVGITFYRIIRTMIYEEVESRLKVEKRDFETYISIHNTWESNSYFVENKIEVKAANGRFSKKLFLPIRSFTIAMKKAWTLSGSLHFIQ